jgi:O-Antigen ligase
MIRRGRVKSPADALRTLQFWVAALVLVFAPLFFGSVDQFWVVSWTILLSISAGLGGLRTFDERQSRVLIVFAGLCCAYALIAIVQIAPDAIKQFNDPIWDQANRSGYVQVLPRISSRAEVPAAAIGHGLLFATAFLSGFSLGTSRGRSEMLFNIARYAILAYMIYGLIALVLTPDLLLWDEKTAYRGLLTASFVNHNTAATLAGVGAILWACATYAAARSVGYSSLHLLLLSQAQEANLLRVAGRAAAALACIFALLATNSRGGLICTALGLSVAMLLMGEHHRLKKLWQRLAIAAAFVVISLGLVLRLGRIASQGLIDDNRWSVYTFIFQAIKERPFVGWGLGSFGDVFPALRSPSFPSWGLWDYAHSTILEMALEMGLPCAAVVVGAALLSVILLIRAAIRSEGRERRYLAAASGISVLTYLHSTIDFSLQIPGYFVVFAILLGCGLARATAGTYAVASQKEKAEINQNAASAAAP